MDALYVALFVVILGCVVDLERRVGSIDATVKRLEKNATGKNNRKE
jgi:uncharacterized ion transporter superfamily protein YfcC